MKKFLLTFGLAGLIFFGSNHGALAASNTYKVKSGDSLYRIAKIHKITINNLKQWNKLKSDIIHPNQKLKVTKVASSKPVKKAKASKSQSKKLKVVKTFTVEATAYTANCRRCSEEQLLV